MGAAAAQTFLKASLGHAMVSHGMGMAGDRVPMFKGCKQGAPENPVLWKLILDEALGPLLRKWQKRGCGIYLSAAEAGPDGNTPKSWGDIGWVNCLA